VAKAALLMLVQCSSTAFLNLIARASLKEGDNLAAGTRSTQ